MKAILVSVDYSDLLEITLPANARHFDEVTVVTTARDRKTIELVHDLFPDHPNLSMLVTDAFYRQGAEFNKGLAVVRSCDVREENDWFCLLDADVILPDRPDWGDLEPGHICCPSRRICDDPAKYRDSWENFPVLQDTVLASFCLVFHSRDPNVQRPDWYPTNYRHAGTADTEFVQRWPAEKQHRLPWSVLHLGKPAVNWMGRVERYLDGTVPPKAEERNRKMQEMFAQRGEANDYSKERL